MRATIPVEDTTRSYLRKKKSLLQAKMIKRVTWDDFFTKYVLVKGVDTK